jgi:hypothetical protein
MLGTTKTPDSRVKRLLEKLEIKYTVDKDGDFIVVFDMGEDRSQKAFICSSTQQYRDLEIRTIFSAGYESVIENTLPSNVANRLLEQNHRIKLGAWAKIGNIAVFESKIDANADADTLLAVLNFTLEVADEMEKELMKDKDQF